MEYISVEQFTKQSENVQKVLKNWWKPQWTDLIYDQNEEYRLADSKYGAIEKTKCIPLFTEGQLRKFIEDKIGCKVEIVYVSKEGVKNEKSYYRIERFLYLDGDINNSSWKAETDSLLEAYWQVACKIAN